MPLFTEAETRALLTEPLRYLPLWQPGDPKRPSFAPVLRELVQRESRLPGEWDYIRTFQRMDLQPPPEDEALHRSLRRRLLVAETNGLWRMRVPLMQRWLRQRG